MNIAALDNRREAAALHLSRIALSDQAHITDQARLGQLLGTAKYTARTARRSSRGRKNSLINRQEAIADLTIGPLVRHRNLKLVCSRMEQLRNVDAIRRRPD